MASEYGELEQLVNDVTNLDTARMTLRWALERLNSIEKEKADLKKNLIIAEDTAKQVQGRLGLLEDSFKSRSKSLGEKEEFYAKLEATMSLLGEGKLDIQQLLKKEARLDQLRKNLEDEYQDKFEELDRSQRAVVERWNTRLLEVEGQYAAKLGESQKKYDSLRSDLETDYQARLLALQNSFAGRERELTGRIGLLENSLKAGEHKLEDRKKELETEFLGKKQELDENYRKLKNLLEQGLEEKLRAMDSDHGAQVRALELSWNTERERLIEEQRVRETQFVSAQARIKEIENLLASQQESHHGELLKIISEKEAAFRSKMESLEKEKEAYARTVTRLQEQIDAKEAQWAIERENLKTEFSRQVSHIDTSVRERADVLEKEYAAKKEELDLVAAAVRQEVEEQFNSRLAFERAAMGEERNRDKETQLYKEGALKKADEKIKELERTLSSLKEEHHRELISASAKTDALAQERVETVRAEYEARKAALEKEFEFKFADRVKALEFEKARAAETVSVREDQLGRAYQKVKALESGLEALKAEYSKEKAELVVAQEDKIRSLSAAFEAERGRYAGETAQKEAALKKEIEALGVSVSGKEKELALEREKIAGELAKVSAQAEALAQERVETVRAEYEARKAALEKEFEFKFADRMKALEFEKARAAETVAVREGQLGRAYQKVKALERGLEVLKAEYSNEKAALAEAHEEKLKTQSAAFKADLDRCSEEAAQKEAALKREIEALSRSVSGKEKELLFEREKLANELVKVSAESQAMIEERVSAVRAQYEERKAALERQFEAKFSDRVKALEFEKARAAETLAVREGQLGRAYQRVKVLESGIEALKAEHAHEKAALAAVHEEKIKRLAAGAEALMERRILDERASKESAVKAADGKIKDLREMLASLNQKHRAELEEEKKTYNLTVERLAAEWKEKEAALLAEMEKASKESSRKTLVYQEQLSGKEAAFELERAAFDEKTAALRANFAEAWARASARTEAAAEERVAAVRAQYEERKAALERQLRAEFFDRMKALEFDKAQAAETISLKEGQLESAYNKMKTLESAQAALSLKHNAELEEAKRSYGFIIERLAAETKKKEAALLAETEKSSKESSQKALAYQEQLAAREAAFERERAAFNDKTASLRAALAAKERELALEREKLSEAMAAQAAVVEAAVEERVAEARSRYEERKNSLERQFEAELADRLKAFEFEKARSSETIAVKEGRLELAYEKVKALQQEVDAQRTAFEEKLSSLRGALISKESAIAARAEELAAAACASFDARLAAAQENFAREKEHLREELAGRERYIEAADLKVRQLESEMLNRLQESSRVMIEQLAVREAGFRALLEEQLAKQRDMERDCADRLEDHEKESGERIRQLEEMLSAKERIIAENEKHHSAELDKHHAELSLRLNRANEELLARKQELAQREDEISERRLELERDYAGKMSSAEKLKAELTRAIIEYKGRRQP